MEHVSDVQFAAPLRGQAESAGSGDRARPSQRAIGHPPEVGIHGNTHFLMSDTNNLQIAVSAGGRAAGHDLKVSIGELNPLLRGWGAYFRMGNADREFNKMDGFVYRWLKRWLYRRGGQRTGRARAWTSEGFWNMGLYKLQGTVRYPSQSAPSKIIGKPYAGTPHVRFERGSIELEVMRRALNLGARQTPPLIAHVPRLVKLDESSNVRTQTIDHPTYQSLCAALPDAERWLTVLGYHMGWRIGRLLELTWERVDFEDGVIYAPDRQREGKQVGTAPIYGDMQTVLVEARHGDPISQL